MPTSRLEAFSDGVFAIAITLLVLEFHVPTSLENLNHFLLNLWPSFTAFAISVLLIGLVWANHHSMFRHIVRVDRWLMFLNVLLLADVALLPFPTALLAYALRYPSQLHTAAFFYGLMLTIGGIFFNAMWLYATTRKQLVNPKTSKRYLERTSRRFLVGPVSYGLATLIALFAPLLSLACYAALILYFWPPGGEDPATQQE